MTECNSLLIKTLLTSVASFCGFITLLPAQEKLHPSLNPPRQVMIGDRPIDIQRSGHSAPCFADIDGDGLRDLIVGEYFEGRVRVYHNSGSMMEPKFKDFTWIHAGSGHAKVPSD